MKPILPPDFTPTFPDLIDNTCRSTFSSCLQKGAWQSFYNLTPKTPSIHLHAGGAFAKGIEVTRKCFFDQQLDPVQSLRQGIEALIAFWGDFECDEDHPKSCNKLVQGLIAYFVEYPLESSTPTPLRNSDGSHAIEFTFSLEIPGGFTHPETGNPLLYAGRFDMLGEFNNTLFAVDEKTTSQLGASWNNQWELDSQFTGYCWGAREFGYPVAGAILRGISFLKSGKNGFAQAVIYRPEWKINRWLSNLQYDIERMLEIYHQIKTHGLEAFIPRALDKSTCANYGGCTFRQACESPQTFPIGIFETFFAKRVWNPLHKED